jgi:hypothetical protein
VRDKGGAAGGAAAPTQAPGVQMIQTGGACCAVAAWQLLGCAVLRCVLCCAVGVSQHHLSCRVGPPRLLQAITRRSRATTRRSPTVSRATARHSPAMASRHPATMRRGRLRATPSSRATRSSRCIAEGALGLLDHGHFGFPGPPAARRGACAIDSRARAAPLVQWALCGETVAAAALICPRGAANVPAWGGVQGCAP